MNEPTEEQVMQFWGWCGFRHIPAKYCKSCKRWEGEYWIKEGVGARIYRPDMLRLLDLNGLFKWAVPKLRGVEITYPSVLFDQPTCESRVWGIKETDKTVVVYDRDPALALFWAIWKLARLDCNATKEAK